MPFDLSSVYFLNSIFSSSNLLEWLVVFWGQYIPYFVVVIVLLFPVSKYFKANGKIIFLSATFSVAISEFISRVLLLQVFHRARPFVLNDGITPIIYRGLTNYFDSFPSGHATFMFAIAVSVYYFDRKIGRLFIILGILVVISRIAAGIHYPSDVLVGALIGGIVGYFVSMIFKSFYKHLEIKIWR